jgi:hypothetical protein
MRAWILGLIVVGRAAAEPSGSPAKPHNDAKLIDATQAARLLYGGESVPKCADIACLIEHRYAGDAKAGVLAAALYKASGSVAGVGPDEQMDGGYRGKIHLVPQLPIRGYRQHLTWVTAAMTSIDGFFTELFAKQTAPHYRWRDLAFRFVRSVGKRTPSAYATGWAIEYNVEGSLLTSEAGVRETLFHELFHSNDEDHGDWSVKTLATDYDAIVKRCGTKVSCLAPFAPNVTMVRGGTYYAFQQNNGVAVHEYAAELAVRYFDEQTLMLRSGKLAKPAFKCGPPENARSWQALVDEFFAGRDLVPACNL